MATDDSYMKNKLKDILRVTEEAQLKNDIITNNTDSNNTLNNSNNISTSPIINNNNNNITNLTINGNGINNENENVKIVESNDNVEISNDVSKNIENQLADGLNNDIQNNNNLSTDASNCNNAASTTSTTTVTTPTITVTSSSTVIVPTPTIYQKSYNSFQKPINSFAYRQASAAAMTPYILAQSPSPYGAIRIPYLSQTPTPTTAPQYYTTGAQYSNLAAPALQQQFYLCRGPNGLTYVAAPQAHVLGASAAQAAYLQTAGAAATYAGAPTAYKLPVAALQQFAGAGPQPPQPQSQQQIIYQAAPQPSQSAAAASAANKSAGILTATNNIVVAGANVQQQNALQAASQQQAQQALQAASQQQTVQQTQVSVHVPQTQSPKQNVAASNGQTTNSQQYNTTQYSPQNTTQVYATQNQINQINQMQQLQAAYQGQPTYLAYTPSGNNITTTMGQAFYTNPSSYVLAQAGSGQQYASPAQAGIYGYAAQIPGTVSNGYATQHQASQLSMTLPTGAQASGGYQIINYGQVQGIGGSAAAVQLDQFGQATGIPRPRLINVRHHPYQRN
jgi:hypothetical protein